MSDTTGERSCYTLSTARDEVVRTDRDGGSIFRELPRILPPPLCRHGCFLGNIMRSNSSAYGMRHLRGIPDGQNRPTPRNNIPTADAAGIIHANGGCTLAARGRDMCRTRSRGRKGRTTYINAGNRPILHVRAGKDTGCGSPDFVTDFRNTTGSSPRGAAACYDPDPM